jgi:hypothetical protein
MKRHDAPPSTSTGSVGDHADKLSHVRAVAHAEDEDRPTGEDRQTYHSPLQSIFEPVPFPRWLRPRRPRRKR